MTKLSVNINKVATLRNARGGNIPNVVNFAKDIQEYGAQGVTIHPRPDEALCDGPQALLPTELKTLIDKASIVAKAVGRSI